ncbi:MAG: zinc ribbon domain-containing protein [Promethearchaeota archaeon]
MNLSYKCPKCGNSRIAGPHKLHAYGHLSLDLPGSKTATLESFTCASCGYTEFYTDKKGLKNINEVGRFLEESSPKSHFSSERWCLSCGSLIFEKSQYCHKCGARVD